MVTYPKEWQEYTIGDITRTVVTGGTPSTARQEYYGGNIPWLSSTEIHQKRIKKPTTYITDLGLQYSSAKIAPERSVLIALAGQGKTRGTVAYLTRPMALNQSLAALVTNEKSNPEYLYYLIESMYLPLRELSSGDGGRGGLNKKLIKGVTVTIPVDVAEQEDIAEALSTFDTYIADLAELIEKKRGIRDGALEDLISGRTRLDGIDYEWQEGKIGDILKILHGRNQRAVESYGGKYPILGTGGVIGKAIEFLCDWECVLIGRKGTIDKPMYMNEPFWTIDTLYYSKPTENQCVKYQYYLFCTIEWYDYTESSGRPSLAKKVIESIPIKIPRYEEQVKIAKTLTAMDEEIEALEAERDKMIQIREGAMDDLLTGRVRLRV